MKKLTVLAFACLFWVAGCASDDATVAMSPELAAFTAKIDQDIAQMKAKLPILTQNIELTDLNRKNKTLIYSVKLLNKDVNKEEFVQSGIQEDLSAELCNVSSSKKILENGFVVVYRYQLAAGTIDIKTELADCN